MGNLLINLKGLGVKPSNRKYGTSLALSGIIKFNFAKEKQDSKTNLTSYQEALYE